MLVYRYGAFETPPGINTAIHVSPACRTILESGSIVPRYLRNKGAEGLGGQHEFSVSAYSNPEAALNTLYFMWRIWQVYHGELGVEDILELDPNLSREYIEFHFSPDNRYSPSEIVLALCGQKRDCKNPIIFSSDWAKDITTDDLCAIEFVINETNLFTGYLRCNIREENNLPFDLVPGFDRATVEYVHNSRFITNGYSVMDFYSKIKQAIIDGNSVFDPYLRESSYSSQTRSYEDRMGAAQHAFFGQDKWSVRSDPYLIKHAVKFFDSDDGYRTLSFPVSFKFDDFYIDFTPREFAIEDCYEYYLSEAEFRFFGNIEGNRFMRIYTVEDVLSIAIERNGGVEPLFFPMKTPIIDFSTEI